MVNADGQQLQLSTELHSCAKFSLSKSKYIQNLFGFMSFCDALETNARNAETRALDAVSEISCLKSLLCAMFLIEKMCCINLQIYLQYYEQQPLFFPSLVNV